MTMVLHSISKSRINMESKFEVRTGTHRPQPEVDNLINKEEAGKRSNSCKLGLSSTGMIQKPLFLTKIKTYRTNYTIPSG